MTQGASRLDSALRWMFVVGFPVGLPLIALGMIVGVFLAPDSPEAGPAVAPATATTGPAPAAVAIALSTAAPDPTTTPTPAPDVIPAAVLAPSHIVHSYALDQWDEIKAQLEPWQSSALAIFPDYLQPAMYAIACAETGFTNVRSTHANSNGSFDWGPWQVNDHVWNAVLIAHGLHEWETDAIQNARAAWLVLQDPQGLDAWYTWQDFGQTAESVLKVARSRHQCVLALAA